MDFTILSSENARDRNMVIFLQHLFLKLLRHFDWSTFVQTSIKMHSGCIISCSYEIGEAH